MADVCRKCGLPLNENGKCTLCDLPDDPSHALEFDAQTQLMEDVSTLTAPTPAAEPAAAEQAPSAEQTPAAQAGEQPKAPAPVQAAAPVSAAPAPAPAAKKKSPLLPVIVAALIVCLIGLGVFFAFRNHLFGWGEKKNTTAASQQDNKGKDKADDAQEQLPPALKAQNDAVASCNAGLIGGIWNLKNIEENGTDRNSAEFKNFRFDSRKMAQDGDAFYGVFDNQKGWSRVTLKEGNRAEFDKDAWISEKELRETLELKNAGNSNFEGFCADDEYIYARVVDTDIYGGTTDIGLVRASKMDKTIEWIYDRDAKTDPQPKITAKEFLVSNGLIYFANDAGIFSINTDGSGKKALLEAPVDVENLTLFGDALYVTTGDQQRLHSVPKDGGSIGPVGNVSAELFAVDPTQSCLYYINGGVLWKSDLNGNNPQQIGSVKFGVERMTVYDGKVYLADIDNENGFCRVDLNDKPTFYYMSIENDGKVKWQKEESITANPTAAAASDADDNQPDDDDDQAAQNSGNDADGTQAPQGGEINYAEGNNAWGSIE